MKKIQGGIITVMFLVSLVALAAPASEASTILVAVAANNYGNTLEHDALVNTLNSLGYNTVDVTTVAEAQTAGADVIFEYIGCYNFLLANIDNWISSGKGYIAVGDWGHWFTQNFESIGEGNTVTITITDPSHPIAAGLPAFWVGRGFWAYGFGNDFVGWSIGYHEIGTLQATGYSLHNEGISVTTYGSGRAVYFGFNVYGAAAGSNELQLLSNAINWVAQVEEEEQVFINPIAAFIPLKNYHLRQVNTCLECITENLPEDVPGDVQTLLDEMQEHIDNANMTGNTIYANNELLKAKKCCEDIQEILGITCPL